MIKNFFIFLITASLGGLIFYNYFAARESCIPVFGSWFRWGDYIRQENIKQALRNIEKYSPEDYERICTRATHIQITRFEDQLVPLLPTDALGSYSPNEKNISDKGIISVDREVASGLIDNIERVLVHEACHAFLFQTIQDFSQEPCFNRGHKYILSRPEKSIEQKSAELIAQTGKKFYIYCSVKNQDTYLLKGDCVFINYTTEDKKMCAKIFLKDDNEIKIEKKICDEIKAVSYKNPAFELHYPVDKNDEEKYTFGFLEE